MLFKYIPMIYLIMIYLCLIISFLRRKSDRHHIFIYFLIVAVVETLPLIVTLELNRIYSIASFFYIAYFTYYYAIEMQNKKYFIYALGLFIAVIGSVFMVNSNYSFAIGLGVAVAFFYIILALYWLFEQITNVQDIFILKKQAFWLSSGLLFWSIIFLFKITLMYWLEANDYAFLIILDKIFKVSVLITYVFFLIAITRKF